ncbi:MAG TPA: DUF748 domain-containing protein [Candidatus Omnitrophica bacterium]|nr:DUF748 domain-containing protein [Candidatus Omnitrophota bacterium]
MKILKISLIILGVLLLIYFSLWIFINLKGKQLFTEKIKELTKREVKIEELKFKPLLGVELRSFSTEGLDLKLLTVSITPFSLLSRKLAFNLVKIEDADINIIKKDNIINIPLGFTSPKINLKKKEVSKKPLPLQPSLKKNIGINFLIKNLSFNKLRINFTDEDFTSSLILNGEIKKLNSSLSSDIFFDITADLKIKEFFLPEDLTFKGFVNFKKKSMSARLKIKEIPYTAFAKYYPPFWKPENLGIEKASLAFEAYLKSVNNLLNIDTLTQLLDWEFQETSEENMSSLVKIAIESLKNSEGIPSFRYVMETEFDNFKIDFSGLKSQLQEQIRGAPLTYIGKKAVKKVTGIGKETATKAVEITTRAVGEVLRTPERAADIIKETGKILKSIFTSEEEEKEDEKE